jgi:hypothetical protein
VNKHINIEGFECDRCGYSFRLTGANEPIIRKYILKYQKFETNFLHTSGHTMFIHKFSERKNIFCVLYKKDKFVYEYMTIYGTYFFFFTDAT